MVHYRVSTNPPLFDCWYQIMQNDSSYHSGNSDSFMCRQCNANNEKIFNMDLGQSEKVSVGAICLLSCVVRCWCSTCTINNEHSVLKPVLTHLLLLRISWWRHQMETFSALLAICAGNSPVPGEFLAQRPVTRSFDVYFDLRPNKRLSKRWWGWWFEAQSWPLWRHSNDICASESGQHWFR